MLPDDAQRANRQRLELVSAFLAALDSRQAVLAAISQASSRQDATTAVQALLGLPEVLSAAILDLQLFRFSTDQRQQLLDERAALIKAVG